MAAVGACTRSQLREAVELRFSTSINSKCSTLSPHPTQTVAHVRVALHEEMVAPEKSYVGMLLRGLVRNCEIVASFFE